MYVDIVNVIKKGSYVIVNYKNKDFITQIKEIEDNYIITISGDKYKKDRIKYIYIKGEPISNSNYIPILFLEKGGDYDAKRR